MSAQDLEQRARELLAAEYERDGKAGAADHIRTQPLLPNKARAIRAIAAALCQQPAPVDLSLLNQAYAQGWIAAAEWCAEQHLISDIGSQAYAEEQDRRLLFIIDNSGKAHVLARGWFHRLPDGDYEIFDEAGACCCDDCIPCLIIAQCAAHQRDLGVEASPK